MQIANKNCAVVSQEGIVAASQAGSGLRRGQRGFTLMEMMVVVTIMTILAAIVVPAVTGVSSTGRGAAKDSDRSEVQKSVDRYNSAHPAAMWSTVTDRLPANGLVTSAATTAMLAGMDWNRSFTDPRDGAVKKLVPDFIRDKPAHADETVVVPPGSVKTVGDITLDNTAGTVSISFRVWSLDATGHVWILLKDEEY